MRKEPTYENLFAIIKRLENELKAALENKPTVEFPLVDIIEYEEEYVAFVDLPGVDKNKIVLNATGNFLELSVDIPNPDLGSKKYLLHERISGKIRRRLTFPEKIDTDNIKAKYTGNNGVLEIHVPKIKSEKADKVKVD
ncbi:MAG: Hsp20/alpha crystallin family protein [Candidatus Jordarchaeaceae archaeon]